MQTVHQPLTCRLSAAPLSATAADLLVIPVFEHDALGDLADLDAVTGGELGRVRARGEFTGKLFEVQVLTVAGGAWSSTRVALLGAGPKAACTTERWRRLGTVAGLTARQRRAPRVAFAVRTEEGPGEVLQVVTEGLHLANYDGGSLKSSQEAPKPWLESALLALPGASMALGGAVERGRVLGEASNVARGLANEPGNLLPPRVLAERAAAVVAGTSLGIEVLDEARIAQLGMGLLMGVAQGSHEPPRLIVLKHEPKGLPPGPTLALVGKGITFDTGGISIKPAENMDKMKDDMSGGAAVIAAMSAIARLQAPVRVVGLIPAAENMPGSRALKPGDVIRGASGTTVEVLNTDAEGRLVLGDAVWYARQLGATHLVDVATLTGACAVALGRSTSGLFGGPDWWMQQVLRASDRAGDRSWPMPTFDDYKDLFRSEIADMANTGGRYGGAITAALFIKAFAGDLPWVHMDIAGTAWSEDVKPYQPKGATGVGVRTLTELALASDSWRTLA